MKLKLYFTGSIINIGKKKKPSMEPRYDPTQYQYEKLVIDRISNIVGCKKKWGKYFI